MTARLITSPVRGIRAAWADVCDRAVAYRTPPPAHRARRDPSRLFHAVAGLVLLFGAIAVGLSGWLG